MTTATMAMRAMMPTTKPEPFSFGFLIFWLTAPTIAGRRVQVTCKNQGRTANRPNGRHKAHAAMTRKSMSLPMEVRYDAGPASAS